MGGGPETPLLPAQPQSTNTSPPILLRLLTHNIRYSATDLLPREAPWPARLPYIRRQLHHYTSLPFAPPATILCFQEVLHSQLIDLSTALGPEWTHLGVARDDGKQAGEYNPIFYRGMVWEEVEFRTIWLSETPERPGRGWDAGCNRICGCLVLRAREGESEIGRKVMVLNTHLDNAGPVARRQGARLIVEYARKWRESFKPDCVLLAGDFNATRNEADGAWGVFNAEGSGFVDVERLLDKEDVRHFGGHFTYTGFDGEGDGDDVSTLDFVHLGLSESESLVEASKKVHSHAVVENVFDDGLRCSDHRAVAVDFVL